MNNRNWTALPLTLALLVAGYFAVSPAAKAAETPNNDSEQVTKLFAETKAEAVELKEDALQVETFARSQVSWQSHAPKLEEIRQHVNRAGRLLAQLNEARATASPWQQKAIDSIYPLLKELADDVQATMEYFNSHKGHLQVSSYSDYAVANAKLATQLAALIRDYVDYGEHKSQYQRLQDKLQLSAR